MERLAVDDIKTYPLRFDKGDHVLICEPHFHAGVVALVVAVTPMRSPVRNSGGFYQVAAPGVRGAVMVWDAHLEPALMPHVEVRATPPPPPPPYPNPYADTPKRKPRKGTLDMEIIRARAALGKLEKLQRLALELDYTIAKNGQ